MNISHIKNKILLLVTIACVACFIPACNDDWKEHYNENGSENGVDLYTTLQQQPNLSKFVRMIEIAGLKERFAGKESFTVWAPENEALEDISVDNISAADSAKIIEITLNHIARFNHSTAEIEYGGNQRILMYNGKKIIFDRENSGYSFGEKALNLKNIVCSNGVVHSIKGRAPFQQNSWELIQSSPELSLLKQSLCLYDTVYFDQARSRKTGEINEQGETVYDSVLIVRNKLLDHIGPIYNEDSIFTCVFPSNKGYEKIYQVYQNYFKSNGNIDGRGDQDNITKLRTDSAIINNLLFRGMYANLVVADSIVTTTGYSFYNPAVVFNAPLQKMSNGDAFITDELNMDIRYTYYQKLIFEPEFFFRGVYGYITSSTNVSITTLYPEKGTSVKGITGGFAKISDHSSRNRGEGAFFSFGRNVLSAKYDVYCVIAPPVAENAIALANEKTRIDFKFKYNRGRAEGSFNDAPVLLQAYEPDPAKVDTVLVKTGLEIPAFDCDPGLVVTFNIPNTTDYTKSVRIDNIWLVPSKE
ncbi:hypothetical protein FACS189413_07900 [Bacteroidia bacterium]|nr:hypothetical protein FACS189413_07900 [Bacteroidia bacterium]